MPQPGGGNPGGGQPGGLLSIDGDNGGNSLGIDESVDRRRSGDAALRGCRAETCDASPFLMHDEIFEEFGSTSGKIRGRLTWPVRAPSSSNAKSALR